MRPHFRNVTALGAAGLLAVPGMALADVTPADVWMNLQAAMTATGASVSADTSSAGGALTVSDLTLRYVLPLGAGRVTVNAGSLVLTDNGDGTVDVGGPDAQDVSLAFEIAGAGGGTVTMTYAVADYDNTASGDPGDIIYTYDIGRYAFTFGEADFTGEIAAEVDDFEMTGGLVMTGLSGSYRFTEGEMMTLLTDGRIDSGQIDVVYEVGVSGDDNVRSTSVATFGAMTGKTEIVLPRDGVSVMALAGALRDGLSMAYTFSAEGQDSVQETYLNGDLMMSQSTGVGVIVGSMSLDDSGFRTEGTAERYDIVVDQPLLMPVPVKVTLGEVDAEIALPLLKSEALQDLVVKFVTRDVVLDPQLWAMFDPGADLPRDPASLTMDMTASVRLLYDLVDFEQLTRLERTGAVPGELHALDVTGLALSAVGAAADVTGAFTLDNSDLESFDGLPAPDGAATITLTGVDALLERLKGMGLMGDEEMMGVNMFLGGFTRPGASAEQRVTEISVDGAAGTISANGVRIK